MFDKTSILSILVSLLLECIVTYLLQPSCLFLYNLLAETKIGYHLTLELPKVPAAIYAYNI